jgi:thioredoxin 1
MVVRDGASVFSQPGALPEAALQELIAVAGGLDMREAPEVITAPGRKGGRG